VSREQTIRTLILDFDGLLVESNEEKMQAFEDLFALYPAYKEAMRAFHLENYARPRMVKFEHYVYRVMNRPGDRGAVQTMARQFSDLVMTRVIRCPEVRGMRDFLREFSRKVPLYVSSTTPMDELHQIIAARDMGGYFREVFGDPPVPKPAAIEAVLEKEKVSPSEVVFVGDAPSDYRVAKEADLIFVGRDSGLPFDGVPITLYRDLTEIGDLLRPWIKE